MADQRKAAGPTVLPVATPDLDRIVDGWHYAPHSILGAHLHEGAVTVRVLRPNADSVVIVTPDGRVPLAHEHRGIWVGVIDRPEVPHYSVDAEYAGTVVPGDDPYRYLPTLGEVDLHLLGEGRHEQSWEVLGAHVRGFDTPFGPVTGTSFAVWAPSAQGVRVSGDFNWWDGTAHPMRSLGSSGIWELFVPGIGDGVKYKYQILGQDGVWREKADPYAFATEVPPATGSVVFTSTYAWQDEAWLAERAERDPHRSAMSIYEVHLASWRRGLGYQQLAEELVDYVRSAGFTHVEFMPVAEHPYGPSWGYHVTSYFAPTSRFGSPDEFRHLVDRLHQAGIGVIVDWVPAHFATDEWALVRFDGTALYEHPDPRRGEHPDWGSYIFNYGRREVRNFLVANAVFWLEEFHVDGLRVDGVASMLYLDYSREDGQWEPNQFGGRENLEAVDFLQEMNATVYKRVPGVVTIAEESTAWPGVTRPTFLGGLGFGFKWNMGWMHDTLDYIEHEPVHRQYHHNEMTFSMMYAYSERFILPISHDEVVHGKGSLVGKMPGDRWQQLANLRTYLGYMYGHPGKKLLIMGSEFAQSGEWNSEGTLDWWLLEFDEHAGTLALMRDLNAMYRNTPALWERDEEPGGFEWIDANDYTANVFSWLRWDRNGSAVAVIANMSPVPHDNYRIGLPFVGRWTELLNTDAVQYGGTGLGNLGAVDAVPVVHHGRPASASIVVPPLATVYLHFPRG